jgi:hypothetical protein
MAQPSLKPQDVLVLAKLLSYGRQRPPMAQMGLELSISSSEVHAALKRLALSKLISSNADGNRPLLESVQEFLIHGLKYLFPAKRGEISRGVPTSYAAPPLNKHIQQGAELAPVWPFPEGEERGVSLEPLYKTVPAAALRARSVPVRAPGASRCASRWPRSRTQACREGIDQETTTVTLRQLPDR